MKSITCSLSLAGEGDKYKIESVRASHNLRSQYIPNNICLKFYLINL